MAEQKARRAFASFPVLRDYGLCLWDTQDNLIDGDHHASSEKETRREKGNNGQKETCGQEKEITKKDDLRDPFAEIVFLG